MDDDKRSCDVLRDVLDVLIVKVRQGDLLVRYREVTDRNNSEMALLLENLGFRTVEADTVKGDEPVASASFRAPGLGFPGGGSFVDDRWYLPGADMKRTCTAFGRTDLTPVDPGPRKQPGPIRDAYVRPI